MRLVRVIDRISQWSGAFSAWLVIPLMLVVMHEVVRRHFLNAPTGWGYDTCWMLYSAQFMLGGAYTLLKKGHIRIDIVYNILSPRGKLIFDTLIYTIFVVVVAGFFTWAGIKFAADAWLSGERLSTTNWFFPSGPSKTLIPLGFLLLGLQGLAEILRNLAILKGGREG
jgi:TRAP-type mannitol/chloroaromatic compound transport system permease small subunit